MSLLKNVLLTSPLTSPTAIRSTVFALQSSFPFPTVVVSPPLNASTTSSSAVTPGGGPSPYILEALRSSLASLALPRSLHLPSTPLLGPSVVGGTRRRVSFGAAATLPSTHADPLYASTRPKATALPRGRITNDALSGSNFASLHAVLGGGGSIVEADVQPSHLPSAPHPTAAILPESTPNVFFDSLSLPPPPRPTLPNSRSSFAGTRKKGGKGPGRRASFKIDLPEAGTGLGKDTRNKERMGTPYTGKGGRWEEEMKEWIGEEELVGLEGVVVV